MRTRTITGGVLGAVAAIALTLTVSVAPGHAGVSDGSLTGGSDTASGSNSIPGASGFTMTGDNGSVREVEPPKDLPKPLASPPSDVRCWDYYKWNTKMGTGCFEYNGDDLWVNDRNSDGQNFRIHSETTYDRSEYCYAPGGPGWSECDYNFRESSCIRLHGYRPPHWNVANHMPWGSWVRVDSGGSCQ